MSTSVAVRLLGTPEAVEAALSVLREHLQLIDVSRPYACRGDSAQVRVYVLAEQREVAS